MPNKTPKALSCAIMFSPNRMACWNTSCRASRRMWFVWSCDKYPQERQCCLYPFWCQTRDTRQKFVTLLNVRFILLAVNMHFLVTWTPALWLPYFYSVLLFRHFSALITLAGSVLCILQGDAVEPQTRFLIVIIPAIISFFEVSASAYHFESWQWHAMFSKPFEDVLFDPNVAALG